MEVEKMGVEVASSTTCDAGADPWGGVARGDGRNTVSASLPVHHTENRDCEDCLYVRTCLPTIQISGII